MSLKQNISVSQTETNAFFSKWLKRDIYFLSKFDFKDYSKHLFIFQYNYYYFFFPVVLCLKETEQKQIYILISIHKCFLYVKIMPYI